MLNKFALIAQNLSMTFGNGQKSVTAVKDVSMVIEYGEIFGFLGPNGAGKTTTMRMLTTLMPLDKGTAMVAGYDIQKQPRHARKNIGYVSQLGGADGLATGRENLALQGGLYGLSSAQITTRIEELAKDFDLSEFIDRKVSTYSGGQRRRLDIALGVIHSPKLLFLDEPSTGLDPQNRANLWQLLRKLRQSGSTIFLTTHYLEEADTLADRLCIIDKGVIVSEGTPTELKRQIAGDVVLIEFAEIKQAEKAQIKLAAEHFVRELTQDGKHLTLYVKNGGQGLAQVIRILDTMKVPFANINLSGPSLDDVFLKKTGRSLRDTVAAEEQK